MKDTKLETLVSLTPMSKKRVLVCPLDWGLGHATRCIPIIRELLSRGAEVVIGADGRPLALLEEEFPGLPFILMPGYGICYPAKQNLVFHLIKQTPKILRKIKQEHVLIEKIIDDYRIDAVISDNRYGLWSKKVPSVFITHQIMIKAPVLEKQLYLLHKKLISRFTSCWIPDYEEPEFSLSGELSHKWPKPDNAHFIGPLSRFNLPEAIPEKKYDALALISGPEGQRSVFEKILLKQLKELPIKALMVRGLPGTSKKSILGNIEMHNHLNAHDLQKALLSSEVVICRSGYSTVMDLAVLGKKAILIPTPGQTEQEYLAEFQQNRGDFISVSQQNLDLNNCLNKLKNHKKASFRNSSNSTDKLSVTIKQLILH